MNTSNLTITIIVPENSWESIALRTQTHDLPLYKLRPMFGIALDTLSTQIKAWDSNPSYSMEPVEVGMNNPAKTEDPYNA